MGKKITDREAYPTLLVLLAILATGFWAWKYVLGEPPIGSCWFWQEWRLYCPGCGGTRALIALGQGKLLQSLYYHPILLLALGTAGGYLLSQTIWRLRKKRGWVLHYDPRWAPIFLGILLVNCVVRNILWLGLGIGI